MLDFSEEDDLLIEVVKAWVSGGNTVKNLSVHGIECFDLYLKLLLLNIITSFCAELSDELFSEVRTRLQELLEIVVKSLFPKESYV